WDSAMSARSSASSSSLIFFVVTFGQMLIRFSYPGFQFLQLLLATLHGQVLSLIQTVLQVLHSNLQVLLHPLQMSASILLLLQLLSHHGGLHRIKCMGIIPAPDLRVQSALHGVNHPLAVPLDLLHLFIFLCQLPVHLTLNLVELQLDTQDLRLFMFQSSLNKSRHKM
uniref:Uncharacterized protein n=1 Tax=Sphaeramia orbicularis TaxID=375764 RepID=A0A672ZR35_9TELE